MTLPVRGPRVPLFVTRRSARAPVRVYLKIGTLNQQSFWGRREPRVGEVLRVRAEKYGRDEYAIVDGAKDMDGYTLYFAERM